MTAGIYNIQAEQGATFDETLTYYDPDGVTPIDLTGLTGRMQVRLTYAAASATLDLTSANGGITLGGAAGTIRILITATQMAAFVVPDTGGEPPLLFCFYDLELVDGATIARLLQGLFNVSREVTR